MCRELARTEGEFPALCCPKCDNTKEICIFKTLPTKQWFVSCDETTEKIVVQPTTEPESKWVFIIRCSKCGNIVLMPDYSDSGADFKNFNDYCEFMAKAEQYVGRQD
jgi:ribosomal protein S27E